MEREKHPLEKYGNGPNHHHYKEGSYNEHAGDHRGNEEKNKRRIKQERKAQKHLMDRQTHY
jgi:hypothetical protein